QEGRRPGRGAAGRGPGDGAGRPPSGGAPAVGNRATRFSPPVGGRVVAQRPGGEGRVIRVRRLNSLAAPTRLRLRLSHPPHEGEGGGCAFWMRRQRGPYPFTGPPMLHRWPKGSRTWP